VTNRAHNPALVPPGIGPTAPVGSPAHPAAQQPAITGPSFDQVLAKHTSELRFSSHAIQRVERRGISLDPPTLQRLHEGVARAAGKGSRDSVVFVDGTAFVVSVRNKTVITAVDQEHMREHVFTNVDSAVIA
jgi:flagellar operon protein